ncbi:hypothetical protein ACEZDB_32445 [Streptacidiphilus sp. N1-3]|uniref:Transcriptional regulator n=1 Tax=Streptacidiphilus alkalitolerans TaxID=3342712 RepID=A0ABV6XAS3_9ACTN
MAVKSPREPNLAFTRLVKACGCTYAALARTINIVARESGVVLNYQAPSIHQWMEGGKPQYPGVPTFVAEALTRRLGVPVSVSDTGMVDHPDHDVGLRWTPTTDAVAELVELGRSVMERRAFLQHSAYSLAAALTVPGWTEIAARGLHAASANHPRIGAGDVAAVRRMTEMISEMDHVHGSGQARTAATSYLTNDVAHFLRADAPAAVRRELYTATAQLTYLIAWMSWDAEQQSLAQRQYTLGLQFAAAADDQGAYATLLRGMCVQASDLGYYPAAEHLAAHALQASVGAETSPRTAAFIGGRLAIAQAGNGDRHTALATWRTADRAFQRATSTADSGSGFHESAHHHTHALLLQQMGDLAGAEVAMARSNSTRPDLERRSRAITSARLAEIRLDRGHLEEACATWDSFLADAAAVRSGRVETAGATMLAKLRPHQHHPLVQPLREQAHELGWSVHSRAQRWI